MIWIYRKIYKAFVIENGWFQIEVLSAAIIYEYKSDILNICSLCIHERMSPPARTHINKYDVKSI